MLHACVLQLSFPSPSPSSPSLRHSGLPAARLCYPSTPFVPTFFSSPLPTSFVLEKQANSGTETGSFLHVRPWKDSVL